MILIEFSSPFISNFHENILRPLGWYENSFKPPRAKNTIKCVHYVMENHDVFPGPKTNSLGIVKILLGISKALDYLHKQKIEHGNIKPDNMMVNHLPKLILIDS
jgi:serine/threonine protein kinase